MEALQTFGTSVGGVPSCLLSSFGSCRCFYFLGWSFWGLSGVYLGGGERAAKLNASGAVNVKEHGWEVQREAQSRSPGPRGRSQLLPHEALGFQGSFYPLPEPRLFPPPFLALTALRPAAFPPCVILTPCLLCRCLIPEGSARRSAAAGAASTSVTGAANTRGGGRDPAAANVRGGTGGRAATTSAPGGGWGAGGRPWRDPLLGLGAVSPLLGAVCCVVFMAGKRMGEWPGWKRSAVVIEFQPSAVCAGSPTTSLGCRWDPRGAIGIPRVPLGSIES